MRMGPSLLPANIAARKLAKPSPSMGDLLSKYTGLQSIDSYGINPCMNYSKGLNSRLHTATSVFVANRALGEEIDPRDDIEPVKFLGREIQSRLDKLVRVMHAISFPKDFTIHRKDELPAVSKTISPETRKKMEELAIPLMKSISSYAEQLIGLMERHGEEAPVQTAA